MNSCVPADTSIDVWLRRVPAFDHTPSARPLRRGGNTATMEVAMCLKHKTGQGITAKAVSASCLQ